VAEVFIGYDSREPLTYEVCRNSILRRSRNFQPRALFTPELKAQGLYRRNDAKAATEFSLTRFLVPRLASYHGWALFCDSDFVFTRPLDELFALRDDRYAVMVVKHGPELWHDKHGSETCVVEKMDGKLQSYYPMKWWSACVLWNCDHRANMCIGTTMVNEETPQYLHRFGWLRDEEIGELPETWHWLDGYSPDPGPEAPAGVHYTRGTPELPNWGETRFAERWWSEVTSPLLGRA
jgi:hypothetical protein